MKCKNFLCWGFIKGEKNCLFLDVKECKSRKLFNKIFNQLYESKIYKIMYEQYKKGEL